MRDSSRDEDVPRHPAGEAPSAGSALGGGGGGSGGGSEGSIGAAVVGLIIGMASTAAARAVQGWLNRGRNNHGCSLRQPGAAVTDGAAADNDDDDGAAAGAAHADRGIAWPHDDSDGEVEEEDGPDEAEAAALAALGGGKAAALPAIEAIDWAAFLTLSYPSAQHWTAVVEAAEAEVGAGAAQQHGGRGAPLARACQRPAAMVWHRLDLGEGEEEEEDGGGSSNEDGSSSDDEEEEGRSVEEGSSCSDEGSCSGSSTGGAAESGSEAGSEEGGDDEGEQHSFVPLLVPNWLPGALLDDAPQAGRAHDLLCLLRRMAAEVFLPPGQTPRLHLFWDPDDPSWAFIDPSGAAFFNLARDPLPAAPAAAEGAAAGGGAAVGGAAAAADGAAQATRVRAWYLAACALVARAWRGGGLAYEQRSGKVALRFHARLRRAFF